MNAQHGLSSTARALVAALGATVFSLLIVWSWIGAMHSPAPRRVPVAVVAPAQVEQGLSGALETHAPGAFDLVPYGTAQQAEDAVRHGDTAGAVVIGMTAHGPALDLYTAGAGGPAPAQVLTQVFQNVAAAQHASFATQDLVPLPANDRTGTTGFFLTLATLFPALVVGVALGLNKGIGKAKLLGTVLGFAALVATADTLLAVGALGALAGHAPTVAGILALLAVAVALPVAAATRRIGIKVLPLAALLVLVLGIPATGTPAGLGHLTPGFYHWIAPALPNSATVYALRDAVYFGGHHAAGMLIGLTCWTVLGLIALAAPARRTRTAEAAAGADLTPAAV